jgi:N-acetylglutamate synthase-like GNAT family acetyltransferase
VAERDGEVVGYTALERSTEDPEATFRLFVVVSWNTSLDVADLLFERALDELRRLGARNAWLREYASDQPLVAYFRSKGFDIRQEYEHDGQLLVTLAKDLGGSDLGG